MKLTKVKLGILQFRNVAARIFLNEIKAISILYYKLKIYRRKSRPDQWLPMGYLNITRQRFKDTGISQVYLKKTNDSLVCNFSNALI